MYDRILFPTDGSEGSATAFEHALGLARVHDATVDVLYVADTSQDSVTVLGGEMLDLLAEEGERIVGEFEAHARDAGVEVRTAVLQGDPHATIVDYAESHRVDVVVMPTHGRSGLSRYLIGSVTEKVVRTSPVPVLTVGIGDGE